MTANGEIRKCGQKTGGIVLTANGEINKCGQNTDKVYNARKSQIVNNKSNLKGEGTCMDLKKC